MKKIHALYLVGILCCSNSVAWAGDVTSGSMTSGSMEMGRKAVEALEISKMLDPKSEGKYLMQENDFIGECNIAVNKLKDVIKTKNNTIATKNDIIARYKEAVDKLKLELEAAQSACK